MLGYNSLLRSFRLFVVVVVLFFEYQLTDVNCYSFRYPLEFVLCVAGGRLQF